MASRPSVSVGPVATADPGEAGRLLEREIGVQARPDGATGCRRIFTVDAGDPFEACEGVASALGKVHPGWQSIVDLAV